MKITRNSMLGAAGLIICLSACATPSNQEPSNATITTAAATTPGSALPEEAVLEDDPIICHRESVTGTRFKTKVCKRQSERDKLKQQSRSGLEDLQRGGTTSPLPGG